MNTLTAAPLQVPVRSWREKAILASAIARPLWSAYEQMHVEPGETCRALVDENATDRLLDNYAQAREPIALIDRTLCELRRLTPGLGVAVEAPAELCLPEKLADVIEELSDTNARDCSRSPAPSQREIAEATIAAIDLRDAIAEDA